MSDATPPDPARVTHTWHDGDGDHPPEPPAEPEATAPDEPFVVE